MSVIILLLIVSISVASLFLAAFIWSVRNGQYDDEVAPAVRILFEDTPHPAAGETSLPDETIYTGDTSQKQTTI